MNRKPKPLTCFLAVCFAALGALFSLELARAGEGAVARLQRTAARSFSAASVKAAPNLRCTLQSATAPSEGVPVFTDADGYARFFAVRPGPEGAAKPLTLSCTNPKGAAVSYPVDLNASDTFADRPLNLAVEPGVDRQALAGDPMGRSQAELSRGGYGLRPDPAANPSLYAAWLRAAQKPGRMLFAKRPDKHLHTVTYIQSSPGWIGSVLTGAAPYVAIIADFHVPTAIPGAYGTTSTAASVWPGLGGYGTGSGLIQAGISIATTSTTASYSTWREYCCGDGDSNGFSGAFTPAPGDEILAEAWYCDASGQTNLNGGFGCSFLYDFASGAVFSCTSPRGSPGGSPCWSAAALPQCSASPSTPNCMTMGPAAEFVFENQSPQLTPPTDQFPPIATSIVAEYMAIPVSGNVANVIDDPSVIVLTDWPHNPPPISVTLSGGDTVFQVGAQPAPPVPPAPPPPSFGGSPGDENALVVYGLTPQGGVSWYSKAGLKGPWSGPATVATGWSLKSLTTGGGPDFFGVRPDGALVWRELGSQPSQVKPPVQLSPAFGAYLSVFGASDGVIYGIRPDGGLEWWRRTYSGAWEGPLVVGSGWNGFVKVFSAGQGVVYAVKPDGTLLWYRHTDYLTGTSGAGTPAPHWLGPITVGSGWADFRALVPAGDGVVLAVRQSGELDWYRQDDYLQGISFIPFVDRAPVAHWRGPYQIGSGWAGFSQVSATVSNSVNVIK